MVAENFKNNVDKLLKENINNVWQLIDTTGSGEMNFLVGGMFISPTGNVSNRPYSIKKFVYF